MSFLSKLKIENNVTFTENLAVTNKSTTSAVVDLFSLGGAARNIHEDELVTLINRALNEDLNITTKVIFHLGDIREGQGERRFFRLALREVLKRFQADKVLVEVPEISRWDLVIDLYKEVPEAKDLVLKAFREEKDALFFKWIPSRRAHKKNNPLAYTIMKDLEISAKQYQNVLKRNRAKLNLVETNLTNKTYDKINYGQVPSRANLVYKEAFKRHDGERLQAHYEEALKQAKARMNNTLVPQEVKEVKVNANVLYPHEIISRYREKSGWGLVMKDFDLNLETLWYSLPNYLENFEGNSSILPIIDVSGSMAAGVSPDAAVTAMDVALGFGLYFAERLKGEFKDHFMTFSSNPELVEATGNSVRDKVMGIYRANWDMSTNIQRAFDLVLRTAINNNMSQEDLPNTLVIFSDMEFDYCGKNTNLSYARSKFEEAGYTLPNIVFWNIIARNVQFPATINDKGVVLISGYSPVTIKFITTGEVMSPFELVVQAVNKPRYSFVDSFVPKNQY